jgi:Protein of unknown function (DUF2865)
MTRFLRGFGSATLGVLALAASATAQTYPPYPDQNSPAQPYPAQSYPAQPYPAQTYPAQNYPAQPYPAQSAPAQSAPAQNYPVQRYPAQGSPPQGSPPQNSRAQYSPARPVPQSQACVGLESQLATVNGSAADPARAAQIQRAQGAIAQQQAELDRTLAQAHRVGCEGQGFFSLFSGLSPRCGPLISKIQGMRGNLDNMMSQLEQLKSGNSDQDAQRNALIAQLAQNNCGSQYTAAAKANGPQGFFEALLGGGTVVNPGGNGAPTGTYRTVCVRTCDGYYFPISYSTVPARFGADALACQRQCPNAQVELFSYRNPGEAIEQAVSTNGAPYTALPNAFRYRKDLVAGCSCRKPDQSWAEALRDADDTDTLRSGDIIVTDSKAEQSSRLPPGVTVQPQQGAQGKLKVGGGESGVDAAQGEQVTGVRNAPETDKHRKVRVVGPPFISGN